MSWPSIFFRQQSAPPGAFLFFFLTILATLAAAQQPVTINRSLSLGVVLEMQPAGGLNQPAQLNTSLPDSLKIRVVNRNGGGMAGATVLFSLQAPPGAAGQQLSADSLQTGPNGFAATALTIGDQNGLYRVLAIATDPEVSIQDTVVFNFAVTDVNLTAFRPTTPLFTRTAIPDDQEILPGVGVRANGDDDNLNSIPDRDENFVSQENDLIKIELAVSPLTAPEGSSYRLRRSNGNIRVWQSDTKSTALLDANDEALLSFSGNPMTLWIENPAGGSATLTLLNQDDDSNSVLNADSIRVFSFSSIVMALGGESQVPSNPPSSNHGTFQIAVDLYEAGYDVYMYDEDNVANSGAGAVYNEIVGAIQDRGVSGVVAYGYSHGGSSVHDLSDRLMNNAGNIGSFTIHYSGYIDAVDQRFPLTAQENRRPPGTQYLTNYYQNNGIFELGGGPIDPPGAEFQLDVQSTGWGNNLDHFTVDDHPNVKTGIFDRLIQNTPR